MIAVSDTFVKDSQSPGTNFAQMMATMTQCLLTFGKVSCCTPMGDLRILLVGAPEVSSILPLQPPQLKVTLTREGCRAKEESLPSYQQEQKVWM